MHSKLDLLHKHVINRPRFRASDNTSLGKTNISDIKNCVKKGIYEERHGLDTHMMHHQIK